MGGFVISIVQRQRQIGLDKYTIFGHPCRFSQQFAVGRICAQRAGQAHKMCLGIGDFPFCSGLAKQVGRKINAQRRTINMRRCKAVQGSDLSHIRLLWAG